MLPKWFNDWNKKNPVDIYGPAVLVGALGAAVLVAAALVSLGQPYATDSLQTGPRGTGMSVPEFTADLATPDPDIAELFEDPPLIPEEGEALASEVYQNVQVLGDLTEANFLRVMSAISLWVAPEQGCAYCHSGADDGEYAADDLYTKVVARNMIQMTRNINEVWTDHVNAQKQVGVTCFTCHRGQNVPSDIWYKITPVNQSTEGWAALQNRATLRTQYTSLPADALEHYLLEYNIIGVHNFESRVSEDITDPAVPTWQNAERTFSLMNYVSNSLGVNCVFCHNSRAFYDPTQVTPQWTTAQLGVAMVQEINNEYLVPLADILPDNRLGPVHGDVPKVACRTCHKGYQQPLQGTNVINDYPELATTGAPVYEEATPTQ